MMFFVPAIFGGMFGLLGGWLTDRLGRRAVLTWSILLYAISAFAAGYARRSDADVLRCTTFIGVCVEFVAAIAWLAELFPDPERRERVLGYTQSFPRSAASRGRGQLVCHRLFGQLPAIAIPNSRRSWEVSTPSISTRPGVTRLMSGLDSRRFR